MTGVITRSPAAAAGVPSLAISVGRDPIRPRMSSKGSRHQPNEDAALPCEEGSRTLLAVADAHHGIDASHELIGAHGAMRMPDRLRGALARLGSLGNCAGHWTNPPRPSLVAVHRPETGARDSGSRSGTPPSCGLARTARGCINVRRAQFVQSAQPGRPGSRIRPRLPLLLRAGELLLAFTDGINECHYRSPETSIGQRPPGTGIRSTRRPAGALCEGLMELALAGVDGNPGGQDNIALVVTADGSGSRRRELLPRRRNRGPGLDVRPAWGETGPRPRAVRLGGRHPVDPAHCTRPLPHASPGRAFSRRSCASSVVRAPLTIPIISGHCPRSIRGADTILAILFTFIAVGRGDLAFRRTRREPGRSAFVAPGR